MQYKALEGATVQIEDRTVTGFAAVFGNVDDGNDRIHPGAFAKTIQERAGRVRLLWQHNTAEPPTAVVKGLREVSRDDLPADMRTKVPEASGALLVTREYLDTLRANEVLAGIKAGAIAEMSIGYDVPKGKADYETVNSKQVRNLREIRLWELSDVLWGMNPATRAAKMGESGLNIATLDRIATVLDVLKLLDAGQELKSGDVAAVRRVAELLGVMLNSEPMVVGDPEPEEQASRPVDPPPSLDTVRARLAIADRELQYYMGRAK